MLPLQALKSQCVVAAVVLCFAATALAQTTASLIGNVTDPSGAAVGHCSVKVTETSTGQVRTTTTDETGAYLFTLLPPGSYSIRVEAAGFKVEVRTGITVSVQANVRVDIPLSVGDVSETVTVASQAPAVDTRQASIGETIDSARMVEMPLSGRSPTALLSLLPGVIVSDPGVSPTSYDVVVQVAGGQQTANNFILPVWLVIIPLEPKANHESGRYTVMRKSYYELAALYKRYRQTHAKLIPNMLPNIAIMLHLVIAY